MLGLKNMLQLMTRKNVSVCVCIYLCVCFLEPLLSKTHNSQAYSGLHLTGNHVQFIIMELRIKSSWSSSDTYFPFSQNNIC